jgi:DNA-binding MarR family transcriptional regulator
VLYEQRKEPFDSGIAETDLRAAAKTIATLLERGYVTRYADPNDGRRKRIEVTPLGFEVMRQGEAILNDLRIEWELQLGRKELALLEAQLTSLVGDSAVRIEAPGWAAQDLG